MYDVIVEDFCDCMIIMWADGSNDYSVVDGLSADILYTSNSLESCVEFAENRG